MICVIMDPIQGSLQAEEGILGLWLDLLTF